MQQPNSTPIEIIGDNRKNSDILSVIRKELSEDIVIHVRLKQEIIVTTTDKIKVLINDSKRAVGSKKDWLAPFSILLTIVITLCTCDFKARYGLSKDTWNAIFIVFAVISALWLMKSINKLLKNWRKDSPEVLIEKLKS
jgi:hypothetical protein